MPLPGPSIHLPCTYPLHLSSLFGSVWISYDALACSLLTMLIKEINLCIILPVLLFPELKQSRCSLQRRPNLLKANAGSSTITFMRLDISPLGMAYHPWWYWSNKESIPFKWRQIGLVVKIWLFCSCLSYCFYVLIALYIHHVQCFNVLHKLNVIKKYLTIQMILRTGIIGETKHLKPRSLPSL